MFSQPLQLYDDIVNTRDIDSLKTVLSSQSQLLGFEKFAFFSFHLDSQPYSLYSHSLPLSDYIKGRHFLCDPILNRAQQHLLPITWDTDNWGGELKLTQKNVLNTLRELEIERGVSIPIHGPHGHFNVLCLSTHSPMADLNALSFQHRDSLQLLGTYICSTIHQIVYGEKEGEEIKLTQREVECLYWTAEGKTAWEIAKILDITERTVQFHISNFMKKLNTHSKNQAVIKAISKGLLRF